MADAFEWNGITTTVDVIHPQVSVATSIGKAQKMFGTDWKVYRTDSGSNVALPVNTPNSSGPRSAASRAAVVADGGTPTRTGTSAFGYVPSQFPSAWCRGCRDEPRAHAYYTITGA